MASLPPETEQQPDELLARPQDLLSFKQLEKLNFEIASLQNKIKRIEKFSPLFPLVGSLVTVIAILAGFWQFQRQQKSLQEKTLTEQLYTRANRLQDQLRSDVDKILSFSQDTTQTISIVSFLLDDMNLVIEEGQTIPDEQLAQTFKKSKRKVTEALVQQIVNDANFEKRPRDIIFASKIVENWQDYKEYLKEGVNLKKLRSILANYVNAMSGFRKSNPSYIEKVKYNEVSSIYGPPPDYDSNLFQTLEYIRLGFKQHLDLLPGGPEAKKVFLSRFVNALCNQGLAVQTLGEDVKLVAPCKKPAVLS